MANRIVFSDGTTFICAEKEGFPCITDVYDMAGIFKKINIAASFETAAAKFVDGASFAHEWDNTKRTPVLDEQGNPVVDSNFQIEYTETLQAESEDMSPYCVVGDIVKHKDGTVSVMVRNKTELELTQEALDQLLLAFVGGN